MHVQDTIWSATPTEDVAGAFPGCGNTDPNQAGRMPGDCPAERVLFGIFSRHLAWRIVSRRENHVLAVRFDASSPRYIITEREAGYREPSPLEREP